MDHPVNQKTGTSHSFGITKSGVLNPALGDFSLSGGQEFYIKNNASEAVVLGVKYAGNAATDDFVDTTILPGWNEDIVVEVEENATEGLDLQWGY